MVGIDGNVQVFGDDSTHVVHPHEAMERTRKAGIKLDFDKHIIKSKSCSFFGSIYTPWEVKSDHKKIQVIKQMHAQSTKRRLNSFLGMLKSLSHFIPEISDVTSSVRRLLKKDVLFQKDRHP